MGKTKKAQQKETINITHILAQYARLVIPEQSGSKKIGQ